MEKDFVLGQSNEFVKAGRIYDLHNLYDFVGINLSTKERRLQVIFEPISGSENNVPEIFLIFNEIDYLELSPNFGSRVVTGVDEMGYKNPGDRDDEWLMNEQQSTIRDHLFIRLDNSDFIRVHSRHASIIEVSSFGTDPTEIVD